MKITVEEGAYMKELLCTHCGIPMRYLSRENIQLGKTGWVLGDLPNLLAGALDACIYICPECRKLEFFLAEDEELADELPQKKCPDCGTVHDFDYPKCPRCKHDYHAG